MCKIMSKNDGINKRLASQKVFAQIKHAILSGEFKPGDKLPSERALMDLFQENRAVIREAIWGLELAGFIFLQPGTSGGAFVTNLSFEYVSNAFLDLFMAERVTIPELVHVRQFVEPEVARLAAINITETHRIQLIEASDAELQPTKDVGDRISRLQRVHIILAEICGNHFLEAILKSTMKLTWKIAEAVSKEPQVLHMPGEHTAVVEAVLDKDSASAKTMMKVHIYEFCNRLLRMESAYCKNRRKNGFSFPLKNTPEENSPNILFKTSEN